MIIIREQLKVLSQSMIKVANVNSSKAKSIRKTHNFDSLEQEVFLNLWRTFDRLRILEDELFEEFGLTGQQYNVLRLLHAVRPGMLQTLTLAERLVSRAPDITRILDKLEVRELIFRERPPENRRVVRVGITDDGDQLLEQIGVSLQDCHTRQLGHLSAAKLKQLVQLLRAARQPHEDNTSSWL